MTYVPSMSLSACSASSLCLKTTNAKHGGLRAKNTSISGPYLEKEKFIWAPIMLTMLKAIITLNIFETLENLDQKNNILIL